MEQGHTSTMPMQQHLLLLSNCKTNKTLLLKPQLLDFYNPARGQKSVKVGTGLATYVLYKFLK